MQPRRPPDEPILTAFIDLLNGSTSVTGPNYTHVPQGTLPPYNQITLPSGSREDSYGTFGKTVLVDVHTVTQGASVQAGFRERAAVITALDFQRPTLTGGHEVRGLRIESETYFPEIVNAIETHHHVATFWVWTDQTS